MSPLVFKSKHRIQFSDLDPYNHMRTGQYSTYFIDHRMEGLRDYIGWDLKTLETLPFMVWTRRMEVDFIRPVRGDQEVVITSFVREFIGPDAFIECSMTDSAEKILANCLMVVAYVDKQTNRAADWPEPVQALFFETGA